MEAPSDQKLDIVIANLLRAGVILSAVVVLGGGICFLIQHGGSHPAYHPFQAEPATYRSISGIVRSAIHGDCLGVIQLGLLLLIATPIARVAFSLVAFALQRDRTYVVVTFIVLSVLLYGLFGQH